MSLTQWLDEQVKKLRWYDISLTKVAVFFATLTLVTVWPGFNNLVMSFDWYLYLVLMIAFSAPVIKKMFTN